MYAEQVRTQPLPVDDFDEAVFGSSSAAMEDTLIDFIKNRKKQYSNIVTTTDEGTSQKQQILEELHVSHLIILCVYCLVMCYWCYFILFLFSFDFMLFLEMYSILR